MIKDISIQNSFLSIIKYENSKKIIINTKSIKYWFIFKIPDRELQLRWVD